jgi:hypothetical protein
MFYVSMLASKPHGTPYTRTSFDVAPRIWERKNNAAPGVAKRQGARNSCGWQLAITA